MEARHPAGLVKENWHVGSTQEIEDEDRVVRGRGDGRHGMGADSAGATQSGGGRCSGLSINRSAVTEIVGAVNEPIVGSVQDVVNGLIDVTAILPGVTLLAPLDIDLEGILAAVAAGDPIAVQVLDENGNIISPSDGCTVTVDALTLDTEEGIALGGNALTGLDERIDGVEGRVRDLEAGLAGTGEAIAGLDGRIIINAEAIAGLDDRVTANGEAIAGLDGRVGVNSGAIADLDVRVTGTEASIEMVRGDITDLDVRVSGNSQAIEAIRGQVANVPIAYRSDDDDGVPSATPTNTTALIGADVSSSVRLTNLAEGEISARSTDAVNGSQLAATNDRVSSAEVAIAANGVRIEANAADIAGNGVAIAANRSDIDANTVAIADNRSDIDANRAEIVRIGSNLSGSTVVAVQYSDPDAPTISNGGTMTNDVTLIGADPSAPVALHNVADGRSATDAVNLRQLQGGLAEAMAGSMAYTDARLVEYDARLVAMSFDLEDVRRSSYAGTAGVAALANLPQPMDAGRSMVSGGVGHHRGETAFALGFSSAVGEDFVVKAGASVDTRGNGTFGAGAGFQF